MVESAPLLREYTLNRVSRVRIPLSPQKHNLIQNRVVLFLFTEFECVLLKNVPLRRGAWQTE